MQCSSCVVDLKEESKLLKCPKCGLTIWKQTFGHIMTKTEIEELLKNGETKELTFISKERKPFKARLAIRGTRVELVFENQRGGSQTGDNQANSNIVRLRAESQQPGSVNLTIQTGAQRYNTQINFGLSSTRECECLALIAAADFVKYNSDGYKNMSLNIELNSQEFTNYLLKETTPRDKGMRNLVAYAWGKLSIFKSFIAIYKPQKKMKLEGTNISKFYPKGLFPGLEKRVAVDAAEIFVFLPANPAVCKQFFASFHKAQRLDVEDEDSETSTGADEEAEAITFTLPASYSESVEAWFDAVTSV